MSRVPLRRPCRTCGEYFYPTGKACKMCDNCKGKIVRTGQPPITKKKEKEEYKKTYFANKTKLDSLRDNMTLERWKILSKNYKLGKKIWGYRFTREKLAEDMDMAYTTVRRCLALDKATPRSWKLVKEGKISAFKLAMICSLKNNHYQDKTVDLVICSNLSTCKIKKLQINDVEDVNAERHRLAIEEGYSRKESAYRNLSGWIIRGERFLLMEAQQLPEKKRKELSIKLEKLSDKVLNYSKKLKE